MDKRSRIVVAFAALLLILVFFFPIWQISLKAPQYPEGLGLHIWINQVTGQNPHNLESINGLNHYIGMKAITPDSIPELKIMPFIIIFMLLFGLFAAYKGNKKLVKTWIFLFVILGITGLVDFYMWEYDYGHNLNSNAPIKIPGMSYQPPLLGSKKLLNITATSMPYIGTVIMGVSILLVISALYINTEKNKSKA